MCLYSTYIPHSCLNTFNCSPSSSYSVTKITKLLHNLKTDLLILCLDTSLFSKSNIWICHPASSKEIDQKRELYSFPVPFQRFNLHESAFDLLNFDGDSSYLGDFTDCWISPPRPEPSLLRRFLLGSLGITFIDFLSTSIRSILTTSFSEDGSAFLGSPLGSVTKETNSVNKVHSE